MKMAKLKYKSNFDLFKCKNNHTYLLRSRGNITHSSKLRPISIKTDESMEVDQSFRNYTNIEISDIENNIKQLIRDEFASLKNEIIQIMHLFLNQLKREFETTRGSSINENISSLHSLNLSKDAKSAKRKRI